MSELEQWRRERKKNEAMLREREGAGADATGTLIIQLRQLDTDAKELKMAIGRAKAAVLANDAKLRSLLSSA